MKIFTAEDSAPAARTKSSQTFSTTAFALALLFLPNASPASSLLTIEEASKLVKQNKPGDAATALWTASQKNPDDPYLLYNYGIAAYANGDYNSALYAFTQVSLCQDEKLIALSHTHLGDVQFRLGQSFQKKGNGEGTIIAWERAVEYYEAATRQHGDKTATHNLAVTKGTLEVQLIETGNQALANADQAKDLIPRVTSLTNAFQKYERVVTLNPKNSEAFEKCEQIRARLASALRDTARSQRKLAVAAESPKDKGAAREQMNLKASENYEKAIELTQNNAELAEEYREFNGEMAKEFADKAAERLSEAANRPPGKDPLPAKQKILSEGLGKIAKSLALDGENVRAQELQKEIRSELEKAFVAQGDLLKAKGDAAAEKSNEGAIHQYQGALQKYNKALEIHPDNTVAQEQLVDTQAKLASQLAKLGTSELEKAAASVAPPASPAGKKGTPGEAPDASELQEAIGHLEKSAQSSAQAEALAPGKNNAAETEQKANEQLSSLRGDLEKALAAKGEGKPGDPAATGEGEGKGEGEGEGKPGTNPGNKPIKPGEGGMAGMPPPLNFSEIRMTSKEQKGQFVDKAQKEKYRNW